MEYSKELEKYCSELLNLSTGKMTENEFKDYVFGSLFLMYLSDNLESFLNKELENDELYTKLNRETLEEASLPEDCPLAAYEEDGFVSFGCHYSESPTTGLLTEDTYDNTLAQGMANAHKHFQDALTTGSEIRTPLESGIAALKVSLAALKSDKEKVVVTL